MKKNIGHIWIGPKSAPLNWMQTWRDKHPEAQYTLYDNDFLAQFPFKNRVHIETMMDRRLYNGAADLMRYEILFEHGGLLPGADSICVKNTDLILEGEKCYTVYENEMIRGKLVSPILGAEPGDKFLQTLIDALHEVDPNDLGDPWKYTGNLFCAQMIEQHQPNITIFPSYFFNPLHFTGLLHPDFHEAYAIQLWGSTGNKYTSKQSLRATLVEAVKKKQGKKKLKEIDARTIKKNGTKLEQLLNVNKITISNLF